MNFSVQEKKLEKKSSTREVVKKDEKPKVAAVIAKPESQAPQTQ